MAFETGLEGRPWYFGAIFGLVAVAVLGYLGYSMQIKGLWETQEQQGNTLRELEDKIVRGQAAKAKLPKFEEEVALLQSELDKLLARLIRSPVESRSSDFCCAWSD